MQVALGRARHDFSAQGQVSQRATGRHMSFTERLPLHLRVVQVQPELTARMGQGARDCALQVRSGNAILPKLHSSQISAHSRIQVLLSRLIIALRAEFAARAAESHQAAQAWWIEQLSIDTKL